MRAALPLTALLLLTACPSEEPDNVTSGTAAPDAQGETGPPADPDTPPSPAAPRPTPPESCEDALARVEAELAACMAK